MNRRSFISAGLASVLASSFPTITSAWAVNDTRTVKLFNVHNQEVINQVYWRNGYYHPEGLQALNHFFRDWRNNKQHNIDPQLYDILYALQIETGSQDSGLHLISGYRSPETNAMLRSRSNGVAKTSLHTRGLAADIRSPRAKLSTLRKTAVNLGEGGVGFYPKSNFIHVDTGRVRTW